MNSFPLLSAPAPRLSAPSRQYYRSSSGSPTRQQHFHQHVDDLITQLTPANAIKTLRFPSDELKHCLDAATASEQSFAMRAALASSNIQDWLDELSSWLWPSTGGASGFEQPRSVSLGGHKTSAAMPDTYAPTSPPLASSPPASQVLFPTTPATPERQIMHTLNHAENGEDEKHLDGRTWMGSLRVADVARYEARLVEIEREIDDLEVEDLKRHVLHHHILPLSPPGTPTPTLDGRFRASSPSSAAAFARMDDLTAVVTAIVLQALPQLSKLVRLLDVWRVRLLVLKRIPTLVAALDAAETAIQSAWNVVRDDDDTSASTARRTLRREEFAIMRSVVEKKVSKAARITDFMLDSLDGLEDTIPDEWIDRIDAAERDYGAWVAVCERKIRESDWKRFALDKPVLPLPRPQQTQTHATVLPATVPEEGQTAMSSKRPIPAPLQLSAGGKGLLPAALQTPSPHLSSQSSLESLRSEPELPAIPNVGAYADSDIIASPTAFLTSEGETPFEHGIGSDCLASEDLLPSDLSRDFSRRGDASDLPEPIDRLHEPHGPTGSASSPSSSPPDFRASMRSTVTFSDMPTVAEIPSEESPTAPKTPTDSSFHTMIDDEADDASFLPPDVGTPGTPSSPGSLNSRRLSVSSEDDQLQQQISEILESIPAKIVLSSQPSPPLNHLNPPDFKLPRKPKPTTDNTRSTSSMSSRSMTPSFLLAPAYARYPRPRQQQRGNQEIKLYHLSRSTGEAPIKLFIRLVGENGERVMVRVGGGWADLSEYLKEYASHHSRRSKSGGESKIEIRDLPPTVFASAATNTATMSLNSSRVGSSPPSRPGSALDYSPGITAAMAPLNVRKTRKVATGDEAATASSSTAATASASFSSFSSSFSTSGNQNQNPRTPLAAVVAAKSSTDNTPSSGSGASTRSRSSSRLSWTEEDSTLGMSGPRAKNIEMSEESKAWVESVKERVRIASGERKVSDQLEGKFGEIGKVGGTKRLFRRGPGKG
ncbi:gas2 domain containing protein [Niveomyces insectorum RCEF 264]|uniref:Gas2 domain containing protein n=1 Tax=Niveomyces insectorum RCEF 264 TaxID=1081102 RepID=A0A167TD94_9HYPO|nr:gas2 domain containing protein [Niveomyces insectorum RCEF 264]